MGAASGGGSSTEPSGCWCVSSTAISARPTATPLPLSVWTNTVCFSRLKRVFIRRAWKARMFEHDEISRHARWPGSHTSRSYVRAAPKPVSPAQRNTRRQARPSSVSTRSAQRVIRSCSASESSGRVMETSSTFSNWCWRSMPRVSRPALPASDRKQGVSAA